MKKWASWTLCILTVSAHLLAIEKDPSCKQLTKMSWTSEIPAPTRELSPKDWVGKWFKVWRTFGDSADINMASIHELSGNIEWTTFPHENYDGLGATHTFFTEKGYGPGPIAKLKKNTNPDFFRQTGTVLRYLWQSQVQHVSWKEIKPEKLGTEDHPVAVSVLTPEQTSQIISAAKKKKVTVNDLLLSAINKTITEHWLNDQPINRWSVPVNLRTDKTLNPSQGNIVSYLAVDLAPGESPQKIHQKVDSQMKRGDHWGSWAGCNIGCLIGETGLKQILKTYKSSNHHWVGALTNFGVWKIENAPVDQVFAAVAPTTFYQPITGVALTVNGRMGLSLKFHPVLLPTKESVEKTMKAWVENIEGLIE